MQSWNPGDRVEHPTYGAGTVIEFNAQHAVIHFDDHGRRKFAATMVKLTPSSRPVQTPAARRAGTTSERTTDVGYENLNEQVVVRPAGPEGREPGQHVYVLRCRRCGAEYRARGGDIYLRRCPACMGGAPGLPA